VALILFGRIPHLQHSFIVFKVGYFVSMALYSFLQTFPAPIAESATLKLTQKGRDLKIQFSANSIRS